MNSDSALSVHNLAFLESLYEDYRRDPNSVAPEWLPLLADASMSRNARDLHRDASSTSTPHQDSLLQSVVDDFIEAYRSHGHLAAHIDPLGAPRWFDARRLEPAAFGLSPEDLDRPVRSGGLFPGEAPLRDVHQALKDTYCRAIGVEYWHLRDVDEREWLRARMEACRNDVVPPTEEQRWILRNLTDVHTVDEFLHSKFLGAKRFSVSGAESLMVMLHAVIEQAADAGTREVILGMAHRGRLNVLMNVLGKTPSEVFSEFEKGKVDPRELLGGGDVKYHLGYHREYKTRHGHELYVALAFNPSHLEAITPVIQGRVRASQDTPTGVDVGKSLGVTIHGDAAFAGQGVVAETLNMSGLPGYTVGGTVRIVVDNQIGFTTDPEDARSGIYCTDIAHQLQCPIFHVNADHPEACAYVARLAVDFRNRFNRDVIIDLVGYRRFGHNEGDDPTFTQPQMYEAIKKHRPVLEIYREWLVRRGTATREDCLALEAEYTENFNAALKAVRGGEVRVEAMSPMHGRWREYVGGPESREHDVDTRLSREAIATLGPRILEIPETFNLHPKLGRILEVSRKMFTGEEPFNWATAELLAYASILQAGHSIRLSGQDAQRGTFSHRHAVFHDVVDGHTHCPLKHVGDGDARFHVFNSPLSEYGVLAFEFGYSLAAPEALVIWEAQFGDFVNGAQILIDQFLSSSEDKWNRISGLVLMLPHGYEGQGPEHSSARLERFLQLCAEDNMQVCNFTTPAQVFHAMRRQVLRKWRKPLVIMTPKSLLRFRDSFSPIEDLVDHDFRRVIDDATADPSAVGRVLLCTGKVYYDLIEERRRLGRDDVAVVRVEQLHPFPQQDIEAVLRRWSRAGEVLWVQEEPTNMGAWSYMRPLLAPLMGERAFDGRGRAPSASPATGSPDAHNLEREMLLEAAFGPL
jgi:2-oxoglutarate dehydrogenase E1 component